MSTITQGKRYDANDRGEDVFSAVGENLSYYFASPGQTWIGEGIRESITIPWNKQSAAELQNTLAWRLAPSELAVGALPFERDADVALFVPETLRCMLPAAEFVRSLLIPPVTHTIEECRSDPACFLEGVEQALMLIEQGALSKIVLSRALDLKLDREVALAAVLKRLTQQNRSGYTYALQLPFREGEQTPRTLFGASPELLISRHGNHVTSNPLAGSLPRTGCPIQDQRRATALLASDKDRREHAIVVAAVEEALRPYCASLVVPAQPSVVFTDSMMHLSTRIAGTLTRPHVSTLELVYALHPTPAVCGYPTEPARRAIKALEPFDRGAFTGAIGWLDAKGNGEWAVTIRCAESAGRALRLFAGAGIVAGSTPQQELAETSSKLRTMLVALGVEQLLEEVWR
ncbi:hypothetical protein CAI21_11200 [Alkalilimnicola ehrlichii]|uniref:isochorismate synthase n=1 Tax=Alkalilimnicola ehrlichii TaxID=351052 RepID=A0A3E0X2N0_9GAMM|nr:isochorismate synthase [Alkalilimnicola ehrlichii]RFA29008.1 hypothetical protein CAI21_11200 [Alkalilimnicola ehrlichii]RFA38643.1 hypothetical protein CAL65_04750 [Alkalilimnicola ehrlichii]